VGCQLPDAILRGKQSYRPHSRAVERLAVADSRVRPLSSLELVVAPPACEPGKDTSANQVRVFTVCAGSATAGAVRWPGATGLTSYLSGCIRSQASGAGLGIAGVPEGFHAQASLRVLPGRRSFLCHTFRCFWLGGRA
jgi:hypothetical protein